MRLLQSIFPAWLSRLFRPSAQQSTAVDRMASGHRRPRNAPAAARVVTDLRSFPMAVVGESNYQRDLERIAGGYRRESQELVVDARIVREPTNSYDKNAVRVEIKRRTVGYLPAEQAGRITDLMLQQGVNAAGVQAQIRGGWRTNQHDQGYFGVRLKMPPSGWVDFGVGAERPVSRSAPGPRKQSLRPEPSDTGPLVGQRVVLWGFPSDADVASAVAAAGGKVMSGVGRSTTLVVRDDGPMTSGQLASATWKKFEEERARGRHIEMITVSELKARLNAPTA